MMDNRAYWIWLQEGCGPGSRAPMRIGESYPGGVEAFWQAGAKAWRGQVSSRQAEALEQFPLQAARERLEQAESRGWQVLTPESRLYPLALRNISNPPAALYVKGRWPDFMAAPAVAVAGAREPLAFSRSGARQIAYQLAAGGAVVVGGNAVGVDCHALSAALKARGRVVSVLPVSLDSPYVAATAALRRRILAQGGALATEYFDQPTPLPGTFQRRNRIITGLSMGVVLIQAKMHSGTMIYATCAANQGREVYVYPGPEDSVEFAGSRALLEDGAIPVWSGLDVLQNIPPYYRDGMKTKYLRVLRGDGSPV